MTDTGLAGAPETKGTDDLKGAFEDFMGSFAAFREANDELLAELEGKAGGADVLTVEKVERIGKALDEQKKAMDRLALKRARPALDRDERSDATATEHKDAFRAYLRQGDERGLRALEAKDMSYGTAADGGYLVPDEIEREIGRRLANISPIRSIATVRQVSSAVLKKPFAINGFAVGWVGETASRPKTNTPTLDELAFPTAELYAMPAATPSLLEDSVVDLDGWIATFKSPYTHWLDPGNANLGPFYDRSALPWNANIDATTMEILTSGTGAVTTKAGIIEEVDKALELAAKSTYRNNAQ